MAGAEFCICRTFSSSVIRDTRSAARRSAGRSGFMKGSWPGAWPSSAEEAVNARKNPDNRIVVSTQFSSRIKLT